MGSYQTVLVGTDGSDSSMKAVKQAAAFAAQHGAKLVIATAHFHDVEKGGWARPAAPEKASDRRAEDALGREGYRVHGDAHVYEILHEAGQLARGAGAIDIEERSVPRRSGARTPRSTTSRSAPFATARRAFTNK